LEEMRNEINQMDETLHQLRAREGNLPRNEAAEIDRITPAMVELTNSTQSAITYMNNNHADLFAPQFTDYTHEMFAEASRVERFSSAPGSTSLAGGKVSQPMGAPGPSSPGSGS
jgi:hypothetical protein